MLAQLKGLFTPEAIAASLESLPPLETTVMDNLFKDRPTHPLPLIGISDLKAAVQSVPVVRRDGTPISLRGEGVDMEFVAPLPIKVQIPVTASELNDLRVIFGNKAALTAWRTRKVDQIRQTVRNTVEGMCSVVASTGRLAWPVELEGGRRHVYEIDYGPLLSFEPEAKLTTASRLPDVYRLLRGMELEVRKAGLGRTWLPCCWASLSSIRPLRRTGRTTFPWKKGAWRWAATPSVSWTKRIRTRKTTGNGCPSWTPRRCLRWQRLSPARCGTAPLTPFRPTMRPRRCTSCRCPVRTTAASC